MKIEDLFSAPLETSLIWTNWGKWSSLLMSLGKKPFPFQDFQLLVTVPFIYREKERKGVSTRRLWMIPYDSIQCHWGCKSSLYGWLACEREVDPGGEFRGLVLAARTGQETSCGPPVPISVVANSLLLSSLWELFCAGHSKCTQWNTWRKQKIKIKQNN